MADVSWMLSGELVAAGWSVELVRGEYDFAHCDGWRLPRSDRWFWLVHLAERFSELEGWSAQEFVQIRRIEEAARQMMLIEAYGQEKDFTD